MQIWSPRRQTRQIHIGDVPIGGQAPITVQSMTNTPTADVARTVAQIQRLTEAGCEIVRVAVPDAEAAEVVGNIRAQISIPLIADIHFDHRLAIRAVEAGADGLRINPGNIGGESRVRKVVDCARAHGIAIRIGVNAGSLEKSLLQSHGGATAGAMVESALRSIDLMHRMGFENLKIKSCFGNFVSCTKQENNTEWKL